MKILHLSDIHFGIKDKRNEQPRIAQALIRALKQDGIVPDLVVFSGDLAQKGGDEEFARGQEWLTKLVEGWSTKLFIVPGNHDVYRPAASHRSFRAFAGDEDIYNEWPSQRTWQHLRTFFEWHAGAQAVLPIPYNWDQRVGFTFRGEIAGVMVNLIGLNSAMLSCADDDRENLIIDTKFLNDALASVQHPDELVIAVAHHPTACLKPWNQTQVEQIFGQDTGIHLFLHGDSHQQVGFARASTAGPSFTTLSAGATYQAEERKFDCSLYSLDFEKRELDIKNYIFELHSGVWSERTDSRVLVVDIPQIKPGFAAKEERRKDDRNGRKPGDPAGSEPLPKPIKPRSSKGTPTRKQLSDNGAEHTPRSAISDGEKLVAYQMRDAGRDLQNDILRYFNEIDEISAVSYAFKSRVKNPERILAKLEICRKATPGYKLADMPDICGFRIIAFYQDEIPEILKQILSKIANDQSPFNRDRMIEIDVNTSRLPTDPLSLEHSVTTLTSEQKGLTLKVETKPETGYSSIHVVAWTRPRAKVNPSEMRVEIQIRSALEDVWGEIDNRLDFEGRRGDETKPRNRHLNVCKNFIDSLISYVDVIKKASIVSVAEVVAPVSPSIEESNDLLARLEDLPGPIFNRLRDAYSIWDQAIKSRDAGRIDSDLFVSGANAFSALLKEFGNDPSMSADQADRFRRTCEGEYAFLLLHTGQAEDLTISEGIYQRILTDRPNDVLANFRLGELYRKRDRFHESLRYLMRALNGLNEPNEDLLSRKRAVYDSIRLSAGLTSWRIFAAESAPLLERRDYLKEALRLAKDVIEHPAEERPLTRLRAINDYLYFVWDADRDDLTKDLVSTTDRGAAKQYLDELLTYCIQQPESLMRYYWLDTCLRYVEDDAATARKIALVLEEQLINVAVRLGYVQKHERGTIRWFSEVLPLLPRDEQDCLTFCQEVLQKLGRSEPS